MSLARENRCESIVPDLLHCRQNAQFVIDHDVMTGGIALPHIVQHLLLVNIDQHSALDGFPQSGTLNLSRLEDNISIRQNHRQPPAAEALNCVKRARVQAALKPVSPPELRRSSKPGGVICS